MSKNIVIIVLVVLLVAMLSPLRAEANSTTPPRLDGSGGAVRFGLPEQIQCYNCAPFTTRVQVSYYLPPAGGPNCWDFDVAKNYCYSPTASGIHWKALWGYSAACPIEWKLGTWVDIPNVGAFICMDRGSAINCKGGICMVDILGDATEYAGIVTYATLWVPLDPPRR